MGEAWTSRSKQNDDWHEKTRLFHGVRGWVTALTKPSRTRGRFRAKPVFVVPLGYRDIAFAGKSTEINVAAMKPLLPLIAFLSCWLLVPFSRAATSERTVDVVIYGATPGGIATALRAAREGLKVALVHHHRHVGGMMANGLGVFDTMYDGYRAPIFDDFKAAVLAHYSQFGPSHPEFRKYEPHVAEQTFEALLAKESNITVQREFFPLTGRRRDRTVTDVTFRSMTSYDLFIWKAAAFVDASYEGDLANVIGVKMTWGREARNVYGEPHAGKIFTKLHPLGNPNFFKEEGIGVRMFGLEANAPLAGSTGAGDRAIQAYNFRVCWSQNPENRLPVTKPARYERDIYLELRSRWTFTNRVPNGKTSWNAPLLIAGNFDYPEGDWATRRAIAERHRDLATGLLWFLQNDPAVPAKTRDEARNWGLPRDEFKDNGGFPWEMYARETRRLVGRHVFTQHDGVQAPGIKRAPVHSDSIAITEWPLDSHACTLESAQGSDHEGKVLLAQETRPGQIPYRSLLPREVDNLLVTVCVSSSHIGWGTVRLEPVWMHIGESAGYALSLAKQRGIAPAAVPAEALARTLVDHRVMLGLINEHDMKAPTLEQRAAQFMTTRGYFPTYDAKLDTPLSRNVAVVWVTPSEDPTETARLVAHAEANPGEPITAAEFASLVGRAWPNSPERLTRGAACAWLYSR